MPALHRGNDLKERQPAIRKGGRPAFGDGKIGIDGGCAEGLQLNALAISADGGYHTYSVPGFRKSPHF